MTVFTHPVNGHREEVSGLTGLWAFLFGIFYFMFKGAWRHVLIQIVLIIVLSAAFGGASVLFLALMWIIYAFAARGIVEAGYRRQGYVEAALPVPHAPPFNPDGLTHATPRAPAPPQQPSDAAYEEAMRELESAERQPGLWARVFAQAGGDEAKAKAAYLEVRAKEFAARSKPALDIQPSWTAVASAGTGGLGSSSPAPQRPPGGP